MKRLAALLLLAAGACVPSDGPMMKPFSDCLGCHSSAGDAKTWNVAGTWRKGVTVTVTDVDGKSVTMRGNDAGNFYTREPLAFPTGPQDPRVVTVSVDGVVMKSSTTGAVISLGYGGCNACHYMETVTVGPDMAPGAPCLTCHGPSGMATTKFSAAGTFSPNQSVRVGNQTTTTRPSSGNFYVTGPITFPATAVVGGQTMEGGAPHGDCNQCHGNGRNLGN
jgi:cytochrome c551/c552